MYQISFAVDSRAEFGIVERYLKLLDNDRDVKLTILATGSFVEEEFGCQVDLAKKHGFDISFELHLPSGYSSNAEVINRMAACLSSFGEYFETTRPDLLIVLGDRYEMLAVSVAAAMQRIPILHLHGGEATYGNYDEFIRHSITKLSTFHFASCEEYRDRIIQLGEHPDRVFCLGALGAENCVLLSERASMEQLPLTPSKNFCIVLFHPETLSNIDVIEQTETLLSACDMHSDLEFIFLGSNADTQANEIRNTVKDYVASHDNASYLENLPVDSFLHLLKHAECLIGNSSSGIIEAPSLGVPTVNIGNRQKGRVRAESVIDVACDSTQISGAINWAQAHKGEKSTNPYYREDAARSYYKKTKELLEVISEKGIMPKEFYDLGYQA